MRPDVLAEHLAVQVKALLAARDARAERQAAALADLRERLDQLEARQRELENDAALERSR